MKDSQGTEITVGARAVIVAHDDKWFIGKIGNVFGEHRGKIRVSSGEYNPLREHFSTWIDPSQITVIGK